MNLQKLLMQGGGGASQHLSPSGLHQQFLQIHIIIIIQVVFISQVLNLFITPKLSNTIFISYNSLGQQNTATGTRLYVA